MRFRHLTWMPLARHIPVSRGRHEAKASVNPNIGEAPKHVSCLSEVNVELELGVGEGTVELC